MSPEQSAPEDRLEPLDERFLAAPKVVDSPNLSDRHRRTDEERVADEERGCV